MPDPARQIVFEAMEALPLSLIPFVESCLAASFGSDWRRDLAKRVNGLRFRGDGNVDWDQAALLKTMKVLWRGVFDHTLGVRSRAHVEELLDLRHRLAHFQPLSGGDAERALDTLARLARDIGAGALAEQFAGRRTALLAEQHVAARVPSAAKHTGSMADQIRSFVIETVAEPARAAGEAGFEVRAGDVHRAMELSNAMPNVCSAIGARKFEQQAGAVLRERMGPHAGASAIFRFVFAPRAR